MQLNESMNKLHINNGSRTYRIPSPTNKHLNRPNSHSAFTSEDNSKSEKGFYVSFSSNDDDNIGKNSNLGFSRFSDRSPIKVPPRLKRMNNAANAQVNRSEYAFNEKSNIEAKNIMMGGGGVRAMKEIIIVVLKYSNVGNQRQVVYAHKF